MKLVAALAASRFSEVEELDDDEEIAEAIDEASPDEIDAALDETDVELLSLFRAGLASRTFLA